MRNWNCVDVEAKGERGKGNNRQGLTFQPFPHIMSSLAQSPIISIKSACAALPSSVGGLSSPHAMFNNDQDHETTTIIRYYDDERAEGGPIPTHAQCLNAD